MSVSDAPPTTTGKSSIRNRKRLPKYLQLAEEIKRQIESGARRPGEQMPPFAQMQAEHNLSQSTVEKIYRVLEEQKLVLREPRRGVFVAPQRRSRTGTLGLVANHVRTEHPYYAHLLAGAREAASREGWEILLINDVKAVAWEKVDGVVICDADLKLNERQLPPGMPCVALLYPAQDTLSVVADDYQGTVAAVEHLLSLGHRRIGCLTSGVDLGADSMSRRRLSAYEDVLRKRGIEIEPGWVEPLRGPYTPVQKPAEAARKLMRTRLAEGWRDLGLTAMLAQNDDAAIGTIEVLQEAGLSVPGDVSVIGFDGTEIADYFRPKLTTVRVPLYEVGKRGTELLLESMTRPVAAETQSLPAVLRIGDSTGLAPSS